MGIYLIKYQINNNIKDTIYYKIFRIFFMILSDDFFSHICLPMYGRCDKPIVIHNILSILIFE